MKILSSSCVFSRRFSRKKLTSVMAFRQCFLFDTPEVTKILQNFKFHLLGQGTEPERFSFRFFFGIVRLLKIFCHQRVPHHFWSFATEWMLKNPPLKFFRHCETFFIKGSPIHQYFDILKSFCDFCALDMASTWAGPGLFL